MHAAGTVEPFWLGMGQLRVEGGDRDGNLGRARAMIERAAAAECRIVVLPECLDLGWTHPAARELAQPVPGATSAALAAAAQAARVYVVAGITERAGDRLYNAALLLSPDGEIRLHHRKINLLDGVEGIYSRGDRLGVAATPVGTVAINICADNFPGSLSLAHAQARMGAQLLLSPSAWAVDADHDQERQPYGGLWKGAYATLARLYDLAVVGVSSVGPVAAGPWAGRKCIGCSLAVGPGGVILAEAPYGEAAEALVRVRIAPQPTPAWGTGYASLLRSRGYEGP
jgi:predicted amidohydrolase